MSGFSFSRGLAALSDNDCSATELVDPATGKCAPMCADVSRRRAGVCADGTPLPASSKSLVVPIVVGVGVLALGGLLAYAVTR